MIQINLKMNQPNTEKERAVERWRKRVDWDRGLQEAEIHQTGKKPGEEPPKTPNGSVTRSQKPAAITREEGKDAGAKSQTTIENYDATPETEPADHQRKRCIAGDKTDQLNSLNSTPCER